MIIKTKRFKKIISKYNYLLNKYDEVCIWESVISCFECFGKKLYISFSNDMLDFETLIICDCEIKLIGGNKNDNN